MNQPDTDLPIPEFDTFTFEDVAYKTLLTKKFKQRKPYTPPDFRNIYAFIPGAIIKIFVKENQKVKKGEPLLILQAMKMNNIILSPVNGIVKKIHVKQGESVPKTQMLVELK